MYSNSSLLNLPLSSTHICGEHNHFNTLKVFNVTCFVSSGLETTAQNNV